MAHSLGEDGEEEEEEEDRERHTNYLMEVSEDWPWVGGAGGASYRVAIDAHAPEPVPIFAAACSGPAALLTHAPLL